MIALMLVHHHDGQHLSSMAETRSEYDRSAFVRLPIEIFS